MTVEAPHSATPLVYITMTVKSLLLFDSELTGCYMSVSDIATASNKPGCHMMHTSHDADHVTLLVTSELQADAQNIQALCWRLSHTDMNVTVRKLSIRKSRWISGWGLCSEERFIDLPYPACKTWLSLVKHVWPPTDLEPRPGNNGDGNRQRTKQCTRMARPSSRSYFSGFLILSSITTCASICHSYWKTLLLFLHLLRWHTTQNSVHAITA